MTRPGFATVTFAFQPTQPVGITVDGYELSPYECWLLYELPSNRRSVLAAGCSAHQYETPTELGLSSHGLDRGRTLRNLRTLGLVLGPGGGWRRTPEGDTLAEACNVH